MYIDQVKNSIYSSNTYILSSEHSEQVALIDCGDVDYVLERIGPKKIECVLLTHGHFDHIYGLNKLIEVFPECKIYASPSAICELYDPRLNYSYYNGMPFRFIGIAHSIDEHSELTIFDRIKVESYYTPGHNIGCMSYAILKYFFTGDAYIPGLKVVTNLRGNRSQADESVEKIKKIVMAKSLIICPGHGEIEKVS